MGFLRTSRMRRQPGCCARHRAWPAAWPLARLPSAWETCTTRACRVSRATTAKPSATTKSRASTGWMYLRRRAADQVVGRRR